MTSELILCHWWPGQKMESGNWERVCQTRSTRCEMSNVEGDQAFIKPKGNGNILPDTFFSRNFSRMSREWLLPTTLQRRSVKKQSATVNGRSPLFCCHAIEQAPGTPRHRLRWRNEDRVILETAHVSLKPLGTFSKDCLNYTMELSLIHWG